MFQFSLNKLLVSTALIGCVVALAIVGSEGIFITDVFAFGKMHFPTEREWEELLKERQAEIHDGSNEVEYLNACFKGGWTRCFENFISGFQPWNYQDVLSNQPELLSGNMIDTNRVAGNEGWKRASEVIEFELRSSNKELVRIRIRFFNRKILAVAAMMCLCIAWLIFEIRRCKTLTEKAQTG